jgi:patatin-related protein
VKEKELRLALVCFGGVSLVLYMHGVIKEILKLARASKAYHALDDRERRKTATFADPIAADGRERDSEEAYFTLLKTVGGQLDLRVIVDSVAGASAGGISGIILARALAHDLSIDHLRELWFEEADVLRLLAPKQRARPWSKWLLYPVLWILFRLRILGLVTDREIRGKLSTFLRSRWFEPPFDGDHFLGLLFDGMSAMGRSNRKSSLLPPGHELDLAVTVTDMFGYPRRLEINTPAAIQEREQGLLWSFRFCHWPDGSVVSDLADDNLPGLALTARATSSFPGVFPPVQLGDLERLLETRHLTWPHRAQFMKANFDDYARAGVDPAKTSFLDGSIVNNKPFSAAMAAIRERPAFREVDRRILYIDPDPERPPPPPDGRVPGFLHTLKAALSDIPSHEPVYEELARIAGFNASMREMKAVLEAARPQIDQLVSGLIGNASARADGGRMVRRWREAANALSAKQAHYAYQVYARLKASSVLQHVIALACELAELDSDSPARVALAGVIRLWGARNGVIPPQGVLPAAWSVDEGAHSAPWIDFLLRFDIDFRRRRLSFVVRALNQLYSRLGEPEFRGLGPEQIDDLKQRFQRPLKRLRMLRSGEFAFPGIRARLVALAAALVAPTNGPQAQSASGADLLAARIDDIMSQLADELNLRSVDQELDDIAGSSLNRSLPQAFRHEIVLHYVGFPFWDVLTFTLPEWRDVGEHDEIRIDRISPVDAHSLRSGTAQATLKGADLQHFAGFLSRPLRESDYLWGRLDGAERLIDIVCDAARADVALDPLEIRKIKTMAFGSILDAEEKFLQDKALIATIRAALDRQGQLDRS